MYDWRKMTTSQREDAVRERRLRCLSLHGPPHFASDYPRLYHLTAACYEHQPILGHSTTRMAIFETELVGLLSTNGRELRAWCVLPTHWHALARITDLLDTIQAVGRLHGRASHVWNGEQASRGRICWHRCADRGMRNEAHVHATVNYIHHNPVHHGYAERWQAWPYSNASAYLDEIGDEEAARRWKNYPVLDYGKGWDDPEK